MAYMGNGATQNNVKSPPDLILVNFVHREADGSINESPQLGLIYIAMVAKNAGYSVVIVAGDNVLSDILKLSFSSPPRLIGFYVNSDNVIEVKRVTTILKSILPDTHTIAGGPVANVQGIELVAGSWFDFASRGDGEYLVVELMDSLFSDNPSLSEIPGLIFKDITGKTVQNNPRPLISDLDELPIPDRSLYPSDGPDIYSQLVTSRGCGFRCTFCFESTNRRFRAHSPQRVVDEMLYLKDKYGTSYFTFTDDIFTQNPERVRDICKLLMHHFRPHDNLFWYCEARVDQLAKNQDLIPLMKEAGLVRIQVGTESGSQEVIDAYRKQITLEQVCKVVEQCNKAGILSVHTNFIIGGALENLASFEKTLRFAKDLLALAPGRFEATTTNLSPYPGTHIAIHPDVYKIRILDPSFSTGLSDDYIFAETDDLKKAEILALGEHFKIEFTKEMFNQVPKLSSNLMYEHLRLNEYNLRTQWSEIFASCPILSCWGQLLKGKNYQRDLVIDDIKQFEYIFPTRTFDLC